MKRLTKKMEAAIHTALLRSTEFVGHIEPAPKKKPDGGSAF